MLFSVLVFVHIVNVWQPRGLTHLLSLVTFRLRGKFLSQLCLLSISANKIRLMSSHLCHVWFCLCLSAVRMHTGSVVMIQSEIVVCKKPCEKWAFSLCSYLFIWDRVYLVLVVKAECLTLKGLTSFVVWKRCYRKQNLFQESVTRRVGGYIWLNFTLSVITQTQAGFILTKTSQTEEILVATSALIMP